ncbi:MAG: glycosyltransferase 87 family protein [Candidatus Nanopelagicales bacterium]
MVRAVRSRRHSGAVVATTAVVLLGVELVVLWHTLHLPNRLDAGWVLLWWTGGAWLGFAAAAWALLRTPRPAAVPILLLGAIALQLLAISVSPTTSNDVNRYAWDGHVQSAGIDPYRYAATDPALRGLREAWLFPPGNRCPELPSTQVCPNLNHPTAHTIYPPVSEAYFLLVYLLDPGRNNVFPLQVAAALVALLVTGALLVVLRRTGGDVRRAVLWAWCPLVVIEAGNNAHVDVLASLLVVIALGLLSRRKAVTGGVVLGLSIAAKLLPVLVVPAAIRRRPLAVLLASAGAVLAVYLPHLLAVGAGTIGFLPDYADEEYAAQFSLLRPWVPPVLVLPVAVVILAVVSLLAWRRTDPDRPWLTAAVTVGAGFLVVTPSYSWYALLLVPLVALGAGAEWLVLAAAMVPVYLSGTLGTDARTTRLLAYGAALAVIAGVAVWRRLRPYPVPVATTEEVALR